MIKKFYVMSGVCNKQELIHNRKQVSRVEEGLRLLREIEFSNGVVYWGAIHKANRKELDNAVFYGFMCDGEWFTRIGKEGMTDGTKNNA